MTGSRTWTDRKTIAMALSMLTRGEDKVTLVHGACPSGADAMAESIAKSFGWDIERHPADWKEWGRRAGFIRNVEMAEADIDLCVAFIKKRSKGATHCADAAERAGVRTIRYAIH